MFTLNPKRLPPMSALSAFEAAARHGSFSDAATELNLTRGAISRQIKLLEDHVGASLFERRKQRVFLNETGRVLADKVRETLQALLVVSEKGGGGDEMREYVMTVSVLPSVANHWLVPRLKDFADRYGNIGIKFVTSAQEFDFERDMVDCAIHVGGKILDDVIALKLADADWVAVCAPSYAQRLSIRTPLDVVRATLLVSVARPRAWTAWFEANNVSGDPPRPRFQFEYFDSLLAATISELGVGLIPRILIERHLAERSLVVIDGVSLNPNSGFFFLYPKYRADWYPLVQFRNWLLNEWKAAPMALAG